MFCAARAEYSKQKERICGCCRMPLREAGGGKGPKRLRRASGVNRANLRPLQEAFRIKSAYLRPLQKVIGLHGTNLSPLQEASGEESGRRK